MTVGLNDVSEKEAHIKLKKHWNSAFCWKEINKKDALLRERDERIRVLEESIDSVLREIEVDHVKISTFNIFQMINALARESKEK